MNFPTSPLKLYRSPSKIAQVIPTGEFHALFAAWQPKLYPRRHRREGEDEGGVVARGAGDGVRRRWRWHESSPDCMNVCWDSPRMRQIFPRNSIRSRRVCGRCFRDVIFVRNRRLLLKQCPAAVLSANILEKHCQPLHRGT